MLSYLSLFKYNLIDESKIKRRRRNTKSYERRLEEVELHSRGSKTNCFKIKEKGLNSEETFKVTKFSLLKTE